MADLIRAFGNIRWRFLLFWAAILSASLAFEVWLALVLWDLIFN